MAAVRTMQTVLQYHEGLYDKFTTGNGFNADARRLLLEAINAALEDVGEGNPLYTRVTDLTEQLRVANDETIPGLRDDLEAATQARDAALEQVRVANEETIPGLQEQLRVANDETIPGLRDDLEAATQARDAALEQVRVANDETIPALRADVEAATQARDAALLVINACRALFGNPPADQLEGRIRHLQAIGSGAHMPAIQDTMAQAIQVIDTLMTMFPGPFGSIADRVQAADEEAFNVEVNARFEVGGRVENRDIQFGNLPGIQAVASEGANNKERALYVLAQTGALQTYMGTRHIVVERLPLGEVNTEDDLVRQVDALREQLRVANNALDGIEGADLGAKVVELRRQRDGDQTFLGGVTAAFWGVVETIMSFVRFIFITMPTYALDSLRSLGGVFSRS